MNHAGLPEEAQAAAQGEGTLMGTTASPAPGTDLREGASPFQFRHRLLRLVWCMTWALLASWTPAPLHRWRLLLLRLAGAQVHPTAFVYSSARIWYPPNLRMGPYACLGPKVNCYNMAAIQLGTKATVSQGAHLCAGTHDIDDPNHRLVTMPIRIGDGAWVAADAFVGPGVVIGANAVIGARAVLVKDAVPSGVYVGNPARLVRQRNNLPKGRQL